jgi:hypothetical protein
MLADFRVADLVSAPQSEVAQRAANDTRANHARAQVPEETVSEATVLAAIRAGDEPGCSGYIDWGLEYL